MKWYDDPDEVVGFARWYFDVSYIRVRNDLLDYFEKPWKWNDEYEGYKEDDDGD